MSTWKPNGYTSASPCLTVTDANATLEFLVQTFGAEWLRCMTRPDGKIMHAEARIDDTVVMISDATDGWPAVASHVHIYVPDVDATYQRALKAVAVSGMVPIKKDDEDKRGGVRDHGGTTWWLATQVG
ncbi:MAG: VOC family protein [Hyphomicrobium sp.]